MLTKTTIALATALVLGAASAAMAANDTNEQKGGARTFGAPGVGATSGINAAQHPGAAAACAKKYKSYDATDMTYLGKDGKRHACD